MSAAGNCQSLMPSHVPVVDPGKCVRIATASTESPISFVAARWEPSAPFVSSYESCLHSHVAVSYASVLSTWKQDQMSSMGWVYSIRFRCSESVCYLCVTFGILLNLCLLLLVFSFWVCPASLSRLTFCQPLASAIVQLPVLFLMALGHDSCLPTAEHCPGLQGPHAFALVMSANCLHLRAWHLVDLRLRGSPAVAVRLSTSRGSTRELVLELFHVIIKEHVGLHGVLL